MLLRHRRDEPNRLGGTRRTNWAARSKSLFFGFPVIRTYRGMSGPTDWPGKVLLCALTLPRGFGACLKVLPFELHPCKCLKDYSSELCRETRHILQFPLPLRLLRKGGWNPQAFPFQFIVFIYIHSISPCLSHINITGMLGFCNQNQCLVT